jgi:DNA-binding NarL/FixJ family response regulator
MSDPFFDPSRPPEEPHGGRRPRILIVDDHTLFADSLRRVLEQEGIEVTGVAQSRAAALDMCRRETPDLVLLDLMLPDADGVDVARELREILPHVKIVVVTALADPRRAEEIIRLGFNGFIIKDTPLQNFVRSVETALGGQIVMAARVASRVAGDRSPEEENAALLARHLTPKERQVLELLVSGATGQEIARELSVSLNTVRTHIQNVLSKLQVHSRLEAAAFAIRYGIVEIDH